MIKFWTEPELAQAIENNCKSDWCKIRANAIDKQENSNHSKGIYLWMIAKRFNNADDAMSHRARVYHTKRYTNTTPQQRITRSRYCVSENNGTPWCPTRVKNVSLFINQLWRKEALDAWMVSQDDSWTLQPREPQQPRKICRLLRSWNSKSTKVLVDDWNNNWFINESIDNKTGKAKIYKCIYLN